MYTSTVQLQLGFVRLGKIMGHNSALSFATLRQTRATGVLARIFVALPLTYIGKSTARRT